MSGQVRQAREAIAEVYSAFRDTREDMHCCVPVDVIAQHIRCPRGVSRLHAQEIYSRSSSCGGLGQVEVDTDGTFEEGPVCIVDSRDQVLLRKTMRLVRVLCSTVEWRSQRGSAMTRCGPPIPSCLGMKVRGLVV